MKAALYARVSTSVAACQDCGKEFSVFPDPTIPLPPCPKCGSENVKRTQETDNQVAELRAWAVQLGHEITVEYIDHASGKNGDRKEFQRMLTDLVKYRQKKFEILLFWSLDRLTREGVLPTLKYLELFRINNVGYKSLKEDYLDSFGQVSDVIVSLLACLAKQERVRIGERTKAGLARTRMQGQKLGRPKREFDINQAREMIDEGLSVREVARRIGIPAETVRGRLSGGGE